MASQTRRPATISNANVHVEHSTCNGPFESRMREKLHVSQVPHRAPLLLPIRMQASVRVTILLLHKAITRAPRIRTSRGINARKAKRLLDHKRLAAPPRCQTTATMTPTRTRTLCLTRMPESTRVGSAANRKNRVNLVYFRCGKRGHSSEECKSETQAPRCYEFGAINHRARDCPNRKARLAK